MIRIVPAIDIIDGKCVRLTQGDYAQKIEYYKDPLEVARRFEDHGLQYLHLVDLDGARQKHVVNHKVLHRIASATKLSVDFGGGIKSGEERTIELTPELNDAIMAWRAIRPNAACHNLFLNAYGKPLTEK